MVREAWYKLWEINGDPVREAWYKLWEINGDPVRFIFPRSFHQRILKRFPGTFQQVLDLVTMAISSQADMFQGSFGSLFSLQTMRLRYAFSTASCKDTALGDDFLLPVETTADAGWGVFLDLQDNGFAQADMFQGSFGSLFSLQTMRLRFAFSTATCRDAALGDDFLLPVDTTADAGWRVFLDLQDNGL
ncbi:unnamed protein product [Closterium sp. Naga37s-1]|nr:unnamed protein product [Closterium sp. Naga37s-1]